MSSFRQLAVSIVRDDVIATATLALRMDGTTDRSVQVWSIDREMPKSEFDTVLEFGGQRLALCGAGDRMVVVAGAWERHGICGYDAASGKLLWQRKDLKKVQSVSPAYGDSVAACFDTRSMQVLDVASGITIATVRGVRRFWQSRHQAIGAAEVLGHVAMLKTDDWKIQCRIAVPGFALLAAALAPDAIAISNAVDGDSNEASVVYCFSLSGEPLWQRQNPPGTTVPWLGWDDEARVWLGIQHDVERRLADTLLRWSADGATVSSIALNSIAEYAFLPSGHLLVTGLGHVVDTKTGRQVGHMRGADRTGGNKDVGP